MTKNLIERWGWADGIHRHVSLEIVMLWIVKEAESRR